MRYVGPRTVPTLTELALLLALTVPAAGGAEPKRPSAATIRIAAEGLIPEALPPPAAGDAGAGMTQSEAEQLALANHPALQQAAARLSAAQGAWTQSGLYPNPVVGYVGNQINDAGGAGQQGGYLGQQLITGGKLRLSRRVAQQDVHSAQQVQSQQLQRVLNDVRIAFHRVLYAQRRVELGSELVRIGQAGARSVDDLFRAEQASQVDVLQARVESHHARLQRVEAENRLAAAWQGFAATLGVPGLPPKRVVGPLESNVVRRDFTTLVEQVWATSPEVALALSGVERARRALERAQAEPIPNLDLQYYPQHDNTSTRDIHNVQATIAIPLFDRNQGGIRKAQAEWTASRAEVARVRLDLQRRLAGEYERFENARRQSQAYRDEILPDARKSLELVTNGYRQGQFGYLVLLTAQRTFFQTNLAYLDALGALRESEIVIDGLLLTDASAVGASEPRP